MLAESGQSEEKYKILGYTVGGGGGGCGGCDKEWLKARSTVTLNTG
jgi:hypothetical protein